ncbi:hypothetical protein PLANPX_1747 [Lacipirellula parvula]|uniref:Uncharacterized protein n=1 Tax=Lacipirellula parvula TaxID=2650471 RepID=A0A5K7X6Y3_9BACT|nr:hypothetical protein PLANPX_1747 [Lacipirellula parvula]
MILRVLRASSGWTSISIRGDWPRNTRKGTKEKPPNAAYSER